MLAASRGSEEEETRGLLESATPGVSPHRPASPASLAPPFLSANPQRSEPSSSINGGPDPVRFPFTAPAAAAAAAYPREPPPELPFKRAQIAHIFPRHSANFVIPRTRFDLYIYITMLPIWIWLWTNLLREPTHTSARSLRTLARCNGTTSGDLCCSSREGCSTRPPCTTKILKIVSRQKQTIEKKKIKIFGSRKKGLFEKYQQIRRFFDRNFLNSGPFHPFVDFETLIRLGMLLSYNFCLYIESECHPSHFIYKLC